MHKVNTNQTNTVCRLRCMSTNIKTSIFLDFLLLTWHWINRLPQKPTVCIFAEEKIHNLPVESDQSLKVHCLWEWFFIKKMKRLTFFFPSHGNLFLRLSKVSWKKFLSFSLELFILYRGTCEFSWAQEAILCPSAAGSQRLCLSVFVWI